MSLYVDITKKLGGFTLKAKIVSEGEITALFGLSGSGKSVTLKCIAGIMTPDEGKIIIDNQVVFDSKKRINVRPQKRNIGYVPQNYALFPNMTVKENIRAGLSCEKRSERASIVEQYISKFELKNVEDLYPYQISGGQQQRVALARALASKPKLMLLDEPFSALDNQLKTQLQFNLIKTLNEFNNDVLFVSHDKNEVFTICNNVCCVVNGKTLPSKKVESLFNSPSTVTEAVLLNVENISKVTVINDEFNTEYGFNLLIPRKSSNIQAIGFKADSIKISDSSDYTFKAEVIQSANNLDNKHTLVLKPLNGTKNVILSTCENKLSLGEVVFIKIKEEDMLFLK